MIFNKKNDLYYEFGSYTMRRCGSYWKYCNGDCDNCYNRFTFKDPLKGYTFNNNEVEDTQGYPKHLFRRNNI